MIDKKESNKRILDKKWIQLEKAGLKRPKDSEENLRRAREAHIGNNKDRI